MKLLIILGVLAVILLFIYLRLRPYIRTARQVFGVARGFGNAAGPDGATAQRTGGAADRLVRCAACETWIPASRALKLRSQNAAFCSTACLEARSEGRERRAAG